ncbi:MAG TPA: hypothetical protein VF575_05815 [Candidatus Saccharimonadales bacterium]|jgi:hypothetical protein
MLEIPKLQSRVGTSKNDGALNGAASMPRPPESMKAPARQFTSSNRLFVAMIAGSLAFFAFTTPKSAPSVMLIVGFIVLALLLYSLIKLLLVTTGLYDRLPRIYARSIIMTCTVFPVMLLVMQSIGQLTIRDILTLAGLFVIGGFYAIRVRRATRA